jgi:hypothetical protein
MLNTQHHRSDSLRSIYEKQLNERALSRADVKNLAAKADDAPELVKMLEDDVEKYIREFFKATPNIKPLVLKYLTLPGVTKMDPDLQLFALGIKKMRDALIAADKLPEEAAEETTTKDNK